MSKPPIIAIYAPFPRSGKGEVAKTFVDNGYVELSFARTVKSTMLFFLMELGMSEEDARWYLYDDGKEEVIPLLGITGGQLLSTFATTFVRDTIDEDIWLNRTLQDADEYEQQHPDVKGFVVADQRFENEYDAGDISIRLFNPSVTSHIRSSNSEGNLEHVKHDYEILNSGTLEDLKTETERVIKDMENKL